MTATRTDQPVRLMDDAFRAVAAKDLQRLATLWDDRTTDHFVALGRTVVGEAALRREFGELLAALEDMVFAAEALHACGDDTAVGQWWLRGRFSGGPFRSRASPPPAATSTCAVST